MGFEKRLSELRKARKISQGELAKQVGVHTNVMGRYERGEAKPSIDVAMKLADALGVSLDFLAGKSDQQIDQEIISKVLMIQKLPDQDRDHILFTLDAMLRDAKARAAYG
ncbi:helix-turn-helix domain-containing protein [Salibacter halophilus]|uniref:Helix-turn-helix transcriptional regulator n=1 Tax=Salibacter halophilus TaxID=1803916 RepID=A0A6N6M387_9FLAO|nr:helix-turn-helix transcriptional regulator [Salibacter halophilus]KAB1061471.1 helix-turn-helix transcriptional regulator [Salibacter halophilus]